MNKADYIVKGLKAEIARRDFWLFCLYMDAEFFDDRLFLKDIADAMQEIEEGKIKSLAVSMPPRAGKSYVTSLFCAWALGRNPTQSVMRNTCTATLYVKFSYDVRAIVKSDKFREVFTEIRLSDDKSNLNGWNTNKAKMVSYFGAGVSGTIIGFGATKVGITDDLYRGMEDALSDTINDRIIQWKEATHDSRFERGCARIDIGTRWSRNDIIGRNTNDGEYDKQIIVKALDEKGKSFCEAVMSTEEYIKKKSKTPKHIWKAEYMQEPIDIEGRLFEGMNVISESDYDKIKEEITGHIAYCDVADVGMDYTALAIAGIGKDKIYIVDYLFTRDNTDITIPLVADKLTKWGVNYCRIESNSMGAMFARSVQRNTKSRILQVHNTTNKMTRIIMQSAFIIQNFCFVDQNNDHCSLFMENAESFSKEGKNKNDDAPDCLAGLSMFIRSMFKNQF
jgi:predicted phage terminase large subunit-like protein